MDSYFTIGPGVFNDPAVRETARRAPKGRLLVETDGLNAVAWAFERDVATKELSGILGRMLAEIATIRGEDVEICAQWRCDSLRGALWRDALKKAGGTAFPVGFSVQFCPEGAHPAGNAPQPSASVMQTSPSAARKSSGRGFFSSSQARRRLPSKSTGMRPCMRAASGVAARVRMTKCFLPSASRRQSPAM